MRWRQGPGQRLTGRSRVMNRVNSPNNCPLKDYPSHQLTGTGQPPMIDAPDGAEAELNGQPMGPAIP
jgi:hypothetical protein